MKSHFIFIALQMQKMLSDMLKLSFSEFIPEAGCDEAGRGSPAGPVYAAAVILHPERPIIGLNDSKKLSENQRMELRKEIEETALAWAVAAIDNKEIDKINILNASILAMHRALEQLKTKPAFIIADGNRFKPFGKIPHQCIIQGDAKYQSIAAASILAKTHRDEFMIGLHKTYPNYGWDRNKGYATKEHRTALGEHGLTPYHRLSFLKFYNQLEIKFKNKK